jgi:hypothetical protein
LGLASVLELVLELVSISVSVSVLFWDCFLVLVLGDFDSVSIGFEIDFGFVTCYFLLLYFSFRLFLTWRYVSLVDACLGAGLKIGVYSSTYQWSGIFGSLGFSHRAGGMRRDGSLFVCLFVCLFGF